MGKRKRNRRRGPRGHIVVYGRMTDLELGRASCQLDAAADKAWFREHAAIRERTRPASSLEMAGFGLPPGTVVHVQQREDGSQVRSFYVPNPPPMNEPVDRHTSQASEGPGSGSDPLESGG